MAMNPMYKIARPMPERLSAMLLNLKKIKDNKPRGSAMGLCYFQLWNSSAKNVQLPCVN